MANVVEIVIDARDRTGSAFAAARRAVSGLSGHVRESGRGLRGAVSGLLSSLGDLLSKGFQSMSGMMSEGLGSALKAATSSPYVAAAAAAGVATLGAVLAPLIALAIGGAITLGLGGALVGVGAMLVMQDEKLKARFAKTGAEIKKEMTAAFKPLIPVMDQVRKVAERLSDAFAPVIEKSMKLAQPSLIKFVDNLGKAFEQFAPAIGPLMEAFTAILDEIGPELPGLFSSISDSLIMMFAVVGENADTFALMFKGLMMAIPFVIDQITILISMVEHIVAGFRKLGQWGKSAWNGIKEGAGDAKEAVSGVVKAIRRFTGKTVRIGQRGAEAARGAISSVIGTIRRFAGKTVRIAQNGAQAARTAVSNLIGIIRRLFGKAVRVGANVFGIGAVRNLIGAISNVVGRIVNVGANIIGNIPGFAHGGIIGAAGGGPRSNMVMVGEQGRELVRLPFGSTVMPNGQTEAMLAGGGGGGGATRLEWGGGPSDELGRAVWKYVKSNIRAVAGTGDGNVQRALGA